MIEQKMIWNLLPLGNRHDIYKEINHNFIFHNKFPRSLILDVWEFTTLIKDNIFYKKGEKRKKRQGLCRCSLEGESYTNENKRFPQLLGR